MKKNEKNMRKTLSSTQYNQLEDELMETEPEDMEICLFMRGGFSAK